MEINYRTKEESNKIQQEEFLKLTPSQRVSAFFDLMYKMRKYPVPHKKDKTNNFLIVIEDNSSKN